MMLRMPPSGPTGHLAVDELPGGQLTTEEVSELALMRQTDRSWTTCPEGSDSSVVIAARLARAADSGQLTKDAPAMVLTDTPEEAGRLTTQLQGLLPKLAVKDMTADPRMNSGRSIRGGKAANEPVEVRVSTFRLFRYTRQSFDAGSTWLVLVDHADALTDDQDHDFIRKLTNAASAVHVFAETPLFSSWESTHRLVCLLGLQAFPSGRQRFRSEFLSFSGFGLHEVVEWNGDALASLTDMLALHHYQREEPVAVVLPEPIHLVEHRLRHAPTTGQAHAA